LFSRLGTYLSNAGYRWDDLQKLLSAISPAFHGISSAPNRFDFSHFVERVDEFELPASADGDPRLTYVDIAFPNEPPSEMEINGFQDLPLEEVPFGTQRVEAEGVNKNEQKR
jgi:hypothetical protein